MDTRWEWQLAVDANQRLVDLPTEAFTEDGRDDLEALLFPDWTVTATHHSPSQVHFSRCYVLRHTTEPWWLAHTPTGDNTSRMRWRNREASERWFLATVQPTDLSVAVDLHEFAETHYNRGVATDQRHLCQWLLQQLPGEHAAGLALLLSMQASP